MATPLVAWMDQVSTDFEASTPPDRTDVTYHEVDGKRFLTGSSGARSFMFDLPSRLEPVGEAGAAATQVEWLVPIKLRLPATGRSQQALVDACANETNLLMRTIETRATWPNGVLEVITEEAEPEREDKGDVLYSIPVRVLCNETD